MEEEDVLGVEEVLSSTDTKPVSQGGRPPGKETSLTFLHREIRESAKINKRVRGLIDRVLDRAEKYLKENPAPEAAIAILDPLNQTLQRTTEGLSKLGAIAVKHQEAEKTVGVETRDGEELLRELLK